MDVIKVLRYITRSKKVPFADWLAELGNSHQAIVLERIARLRLGNYGDCKNIKSGGGVWELRIQYGPGYRVYFGKDGNTIVILLLGGDKGSQHRDIDKAKRYWIDYKESKHG